MSTEMDDFRDRLMKAAAHAHVPFKPQAIADLISTDRRKAAVWLEGGLPRADKLFALATQLGVDPRWLATGEGAMLAKGQAADLSEQEADLLERYRSADPRWRLSLRLLSYVATEKQNEVAEMVNVIIARAFGKAPEQVAPVPDSRVRAAFGDAPHVARRPLLRGEGVPTVQEPPARPYARPTRRRVPK